MWFLHGVRWVIYEYCYHVMTTRIMQLMSNETVDGNYNYNKIRFTNILLCLFSYC